MAKQNEELVLLVVDDDEGHAELVRRNLRRGGITNSMVVLHSGEAALDYIFKRGIYAERNSDGHLLVLLDINMPGIGGVEVLRQVKAHPTKKKIPVIMLTTTDDPREVEHCYELGCNVYITKPIEPERFIEAIQRLGLLISVVRVPEEDHGDGDGSRA